MESARDELPESDFLRRRISLCSNDYFNDASKVVHGIFEPFLPDDYYLNDDYLPVCTLESFLSELLVALNSKSSMIFSEIPDLRAVEDVLPQQLYSVIANLMALIELDSLPLPVTRSTVPVEAVKSFKQVITSDYFETYVNKHRALDSMRIPKRQAYSQLLPAAKLLDQHFPRLLKIREVCVSLVPVSAKVIETVFGKLPGLAAEHFGSILSSWLKDERRIVIYETRPYLGPLVLKRIAQMIKTSESAGRGK